LVEGFTKRKFDKAFDS